MPSVNQWGRENPDKIDTPDSVEFVERGESEQEKGYWGTTADDTPREDFTVAGVTSSSRQSRLSGRGVETHGATEDADERPRARRARHADEGDE